MTFKLAVTLFTMTTAALANDPRVERKDWSLIVKTRNGTVSILKNLSLLEANKAYSALDDNRGPEMYIVTGGEIEQRTIIGPEGWDGCKKAFNHKFEYVERVETSRTNSNGQKYRLIECVFCHEWAKDHKWEWWNDSSKAWQIEKPTK